jgi:uncharacterized protein (DUF1501 family)
MAIRGCESRNCSFPAESGHTFTISDFGRTLTSNGRGSDHASAGNHFVVVGGVNGQRIYGTFPPLYQGHALASAPSPITKRQ